MKNFFSLPARLYAAGVLALAMILSVSASAQTQIGADIDGEAAEDFLGLVGSVVNNY